MTVEGAVWKKKFITIVLPTQRPELCGLAVVLEGPSAGGKGARA